MEFLSPEFLEVRNSYTQTCHKINCCSFADENKTLQNQAFIFICHTFLCPCFPTPANNFSVMSVLFASSWIEPVLKAEDIVSIYCILF